MQWQRRARRRWSPGYDLGLIYLHRWDIGERPLGRYYRWLLVAGWWLSRGRLVDPTTFSSHRWLLPGPLVRHACWLRDRDYPDWLPEPLDPLWSLRDGPRRTPDPGVREQAIATALHAHLAQRFSQIDLDPPEGIGPLDSRVLITWTGPVSAAQMWAALPWTTSWPLRGADAVITTLHTPAGPINVWLWRLDAHLVPYNGAGTGRSSASFEDRLSTLCGVLRTQPDAVPFTDVRIVEDVMGALATPDPTRWTVDAFQAERWPHVLASVTRCWVNLSARGVDNGTLIVAVEWFHDKQSAVPHQAEIALNLSGTAAPMTT